MKTEDALTLVTRAFPYLRLQYLLILTQWMYRFTCNDTIHVHAMKSKIFVIDSLLHNGSTVDEGL